MGLSEARVQGGAAGFLVWLSIVHGVAFQVVEKRKILFVLALSVLVLTSLLLQLEGYRRNRAVRRATARLAGHLDDVAA